MLPRLSLLLLLMVQCFAAISAFSGQPSMVSSPYYTSGTPIHQEVDSTGVPPDEEVQAEADSNKITEPRQPIFDSGSIFIQTIIDSWWNPVPMDKNTVLFRWTDKDGFVKSAYLIR